MVTTITIVEIKESARKHGIADEDILHAVSNRMFVHLLDEATIIVGPDRAGGLLEVGINRFEQIFHAMKARKKFLREW